MPRRFAILDVFTDRPLAGNPLAVVLDAKGLDDARMQAIAREFNLSETVFVLPAANPVHSASLRIFTPARELPFAGHPTIGTAALLAMERAGDAAGSHEMVLALEERIGLVRCGVTVTRPDAARAIFDLPAPAREVGPARGREAVAAALGLARSEIGFENHVPTHFSAGLPLAFVPVRDLAVIGRARPVASLFEEGFGSEVAGAYLYCRETEIAGHQFHARMFAPGAGIGEDPATGSAAAAFIGVIRRFDGPRAGSHRFVIEQGFEMGRPSLIRLELDIDRGEVEGARVAGDAVKIAEGTLAI